ncbi:ABC transporter ATP-binding protein [Microbacterium betulae]|uniref:ABC transporter ATP-binding protein n=1 Tax=Microbacterium betulae TaxID=2981139 RepID=A0AA97I7C6_9MICO|nr:ABC transporter ATP-binding protein [Microbacterium sp. AB]WOF23477.1 ABC transporter ATP-binding protein [Microbacterium sp. AB]
MSSAERREEILRLEGVSLEYRTGRGRAHTVVDDVGFGLERGGVLALVGESGSGKSTLARTVTGTLAAHARITAGSVVFDGEDLTRISSRRYRALRGNRIGYVPQDALLGLNPLLPVGRQAAEPLRVHTGLDKDERRARVLELFDRVGLRRVESVYDSHPHELSGGMCQRVLIAAAIAAGPDLVVADEPTTALDATVQRRILDLLADLAREEGLSLLLVTHDLGVAAERAGRVVVLREGRVVEAGDAERIVRRPRAEYTAQLVASSHIDRSPLALAESRRGRTIPADAAAPEAVVVAEGLEKTFRSRTGDEVRALRDVSLSVARGTTLGIVGESGSGKTTLVRVLSGLARPDAGTVRIHGEELIHDREGATDRRALYRKLQLVYQNPYSSLDPRQTVRSLLEEPLTGYRLGGRGERARRIAELLDLTGLPSAVAGRYTAELSGGQRQRVAIARALAPRPEVLICDEPVSALDVTVQRQVLDLLDDLQRELGLTYLFVSHDLGVISEVSDDVLVLQHGDVVESGPAAALLREPRTAYVRELIAAIPRPAFA